MTPAVPTVTTAAATCSAAGSSVVSNYDATYTYVSSPTGLMVGTGGAITGATVGTAYTLTAANTTCTSVASASFMNAAMLMTPAVSITTPGGATSVCAGGATTMTLTATGGGTYLWGSNAASATTAAVTVGAGTYVVTVTNTAGCTATATKTITTGAAPALSVTAPTSACFQETVSLSATAGFASYVWTGGVIGSGATVTAATSMASNTYTVVATDASGCSNSAMATVSSTIPMLVTSTALTNMPGCVVNGWTNYVNAGGDIVFQINWDPAGTGTNAAAKAAARVDLKLDATTTHVIGGGSETSTMKRYWDVKLNGTTIDPANPVKVRFFFDPAEKAAVLSDITLGAPVSTWFKTNSGIIFNPSTHVTANGVTNSIALTGTESMYAGVNIHYVEFTGLSTFSGGTFVASSTTPLPLQLTKFTATKATTTVQLAWETQTETNVSRFEVQRLNSSNDFVTIGTKKAQGNSTTRQTYDLVDYTPIKGENYYRLKMIDVDGKVAYSNIVNVFFGKSFTADVYPNPAKNDLNIVTVTETKQDVSFTIFDVTGREVMSQQMEVNKNNDLNSIDISNLKPGVYNIRFENTNHALLDIRRFVKIN